VAFVSCAALAIVLIAIAEGASTRGLLTVYALGITAMLGVSAFYHRVRWGARGHAFMARLDRSAIFVAIAASYTPVAAIVLDGVHRPLVLSIVWAGAVAGTVLVWSSAAVPRALTVGLYAAVGWAALAALPQLFHGLGGLGFGLLLAGGVAYTVGAVIYALRRPDPWPRVFGFHELFHACTLVGVGTHLAAISFAVLPRAA
jgi:hemolysin III